MHRRNPNLGLTELWYRLKQKDYSRTVESLYRCITDRKFYLYQYTSIDEYSRYQILGAYSEQSTYSSAGFLRKVVRAFARKGIKVECIQMNNGFEFTNRFSNSKRDIPTLFEAAAAELHIRHKLIKPYTPRHNGKAERSHRENQRLLYDTHSFFSLNDFGGQLAAHQSRSNNRPMRPLKWISPIEAFLPIVSRIPDKPTVKKR